MAMAPIIIPSEETRVKGTNSYLPKNLAIKGEIKNIITYSTTLNIILIMNAVLKSSSVQLLFLIRAVVNPAFISAIQTDVKIAIIPNRP